MVARGQTFFSLKECIIGKHKCAIFSLFSGKVYTYIRNIWFLVVARGQTFFSLKECIIGKHKCAIFSLFSGKFYTYIRFWGLQGGSVSLPIGKFCICKLFTHNFRPFFGLKLQKYIISGGPLWPPAIYNFWWSQGAAVLFIRECVFLGNHKCTISVPFLSKCSRMWLQGGGAPLPKKMILQAKYA